MFFIAILNQNIFLPACFFDRAIKNKVISSLLSTVEGKRSGHFGVVIIITDLGKNWNSGKLLPGSPSALYNILYRAVTFKAFKGEILDSIVTNVTKLGFFCDAGPLQIFISNQFISFEYEFNEQKKCFQNRFFENNKIQKDISIKTRIIGLREDSHIVQAIGSINENFLGIKKNSSMRYVRN